MFVLLALNAILFSGVYYFKKSPYAKFYCFAYFPLMFAGYDIYFLEPLGIKFVWMGFLEYRIGMAIEMVVLAAAIGYKGYAVIKSNEDMKRTIGEMTKDLESRFVKKEKKGDWRDTIVKEYNLTKQEFLVLELILDKKKNKQIADKLFVSINTVKFHTSNIYKKLEINSRKQVEEKVSERN